MKIHNKKLFKSKDNKIFFGVLGGIGEYLDIDPALIRVIFIFLSMFVLFWPSVITYIIFTFIIPKKPEVVNVENEKKEENKTEAR